MWKFVVLELFSQLIVRFSSLKISIIAEIFVVIKPSSANKHTIVATITTTYFIITLIQLKKDILKTTNKVLSKIIQIFTIMLQIAYTL